jgi:hypothetical protein
MGETFSRREKHRASLFFRFLLCSAYCIQRESIFPFEAQKWPFFHQQPARVSGDFVSLCARRARIAFAWVFLRAGSEMNSLRISRGKEKCV